MFFQQHGSAPHHPTAGLHMPPDREAIACPSTGGCELTGGSELERCCYDSFLLPDASRGFDVQRRTTCSALFSVSLLVSTTGNLPKREGVLLVSETHRIFPLPARDLSAPRPASPPPRSPPPPPLRLRQNRFPLTRFELSPRMEQRGLTIVLSAVIYRLTVAIAPPGVIF